MNKDNWYRGDNWDEENRILFESKLKKTRGDFNKAQYLQIKAVYLLKSEDKEKWVIGRDLLGRLIKEYPKEEFSVKYAYELIGDYYLRVKDFLNAEKNYRKSISYYNKGRSGTSGIGDIKLAELIIESQQKEKYKELHDLLTVDFKNTGGELTFNDEKYRYASVLAKLAYNLGFQKEAKEYASLALEIASIKEEPQLDKYPKLGLVEIKNEEIALLKKITKGDVN